jgi:excisionase family DNA binding protein
VKVQTGDDESALTSGDLARMLHVDLKTIHNWVSAGHIDGRRTEGRHLRFGRPSVARFMRRYGYPIPPPFWKRPASVLFIGPRTRRDNSHPWEVASGLYSAALRLGAGCHEIAVVELDDLPGGEIARFVHALRGDPISAGVALVACGDARESRRAFLDAGGDVAMSRCTPAVIGKLATWLVGGSSPLPRRAEWNRGQY